MKRILSYLMIAVFTLQLTAFAENNKLDSAIRDTAQCLLNTVPSPEVGSAGGEWVIFGLARSSESVPKAYYDGYYSRVQEYIKNGGLQNAYQTEYARLVLALGAIGEDAENTAGYNLVQPLNDYDSTAGQGISGAVWAVIALGSKDYADTDAVCERYIRYILDAQLPDGGWSFDPKAETSDPDLTGTALCALSRRERTAEVKNAIDKALTFLSSAQTENGGFASWGVESSESTAQVITALCELGIPLDDSRFVKNGHSLTDNLLSYYIPQKGFSHTLGGEVNQMSTEQCFYALVSAKRSADNKNTLYDMTDTEDGAVKSSYENVLRVFAQGVLTAGIVTLLCK